MYLWLSTWDQLNLKTLFACENNEHQPKYEYLLTIAAKLMLFPSVLCVYCYILNGHLVTEMVNIISAKHLLKICLLAVSLVYSNI